MSSYPSGAAAIAVTNSVLPLRELFNNLYSAIQGFINRESETSEGDIKQLEGYLNEQVDVVCSKLNPNIDVDFRETCIRSPQPVYSFSTSVPTGRLMKEEATSSKVKHVVQNYAIPSYLLSPTVKNNALNEASLASTDSSDAEQEIARIIKSGRFSVLSPSTIKFVRDYFKKHYSKIARNKMQVVKSCQEHLRCSFNSIYLLITFLLNPNSVKTSEDISETSSQSALHLRDIYTPYTTTRSKIGVKLEDKRSPPPTSAVQSSLINCETEDIDDILKQHDIECIITKYLSPTKKNQPVTTRPTFMTKTPTRKAVRTGKTQTEEENEQIESYQDSNQPRKQIKLEVDNNPSSYVEEEEEEDQDDDDDEEEDDDDRLRFSPNDMKLIRKYQVLV